MGRAIGLFSTAWDAYMEQPWAIIAARVVGDLAGLAFVLVGAGPFLFRMVTSTAMPTALDAGLAAAGVLAAAVAVTVLRTGLIAILHDVLEGRETGWRRMVEAARDRFWIIVGAYLVMVGILAVATLVLLAPAIAAFALDAPLPGIILGLLGGVVLLGGSLLFVFIDQAVIIHGVDAVDAVRESVAFARGRYVLVLKLFLLMAALGIAVSLVPYIGSVVSSLVVVPVARLAYTRLYLDEGPV